MGVFLFDIDLTLLATGGAGLRAMDRAARDMLGARDALAGVSFAGRTDRAIVRDLVARAGRDVDDLEGGFDAWLVRFADAYAAHLAVTLHETAGRALPGAHAVVARLAERPGARVGVATGNFRRTGRMKLAHYGFGPPLDEGGWADDAESRPALVARAAERIGGAGALARPGGVVVIGDTPLDVAAAHANGFRALAVATGDYDAAALAAAGADAVVDDLADVDAVVERLAALAGVVDPA